MPIETLAGLAALAGADLFAQAAEQRSSIVVSPELQAWIDERLDGSVASITAAFACAALVSGVRLLAETCAKVPLKVYQRDPADPDARTEARDHALYEVLAHSPNPEMTSFEWRERMMVDAVCYGESLNQLVLNGRGDVIEIWPLEPEKATAERDPRTRQIVWSYDGERGRRTFAAWEVLHIPIMRREIRGVSLVKLAAEAIGISVDAQKFASRFFRQGTAPSLVFEFPHDMGEQNRDKWAKFIRENYGGVTNAHKNIIAGSGMKIHSLDRDLTKLQLHDVRKFQVTEIARVLRVPPHLLYDLERSTNNNIEHQGLEFQWFTASPWFIRIQQRLNKDLLGSRERNRYYAEFDIDGLVHGDYKSRVEGMTAEINGSLGTPNEMRRRLNRPPMDGGDQLLAQGAMVPINKLGQFQKSGGSDDADAVA